MPNHSVSDDGETKRYWTQIPNIVFDLGLRPLELLLYAHMKRTAGERLNGVCIKSTATLVRETGMGAGTISRAKAELARQRPELNNNSLITITSIPNPKGGKGFQQIAITDIWKLNMDRFTSSREEGVLTDQVPVEVESTSTPTSSVEINKNPEEEPDQEDQNPRVRVGGCQNRKSSDGEDSITDPCAELITFLQNRNGPLRSIKAQVRALNWLFSVGYTTEQCKQCFEYLAAQPWRGQAATWLTVEKEIGAWIGNGGTRKKLDTNGNGATSARPIWMASQK